MTAARAGIPERACMAMNSGWDAHRATDTFRNADAGGPMQFPGFHVEAARMLLETAAAGPARVFAPLKDAPLLRFAAARRLIRRRHPARVGCRRRHGGDPACFTFDPMESFLDHPDAWTRS